MKQAVTKVVACFIYTNISWVFRQHSMILSKHFATSSQLKESSVSL
ncbi:hypothetical protein RU93_GL001626 [Enterococcus aquimarinus]|uniref:Uncharacterized protein n=1 Tax=Enterococcus aquimarinus TaxID=328396 RepID=A0A1L8QUE7_9ENTE|nr:hypothetical protein RU93_GL001626 [Enterococcus aquimarinus]